MMMGHDAEFEVVDEKGEAVSAHLFFPPKKEPVYTGYRNDPKYHRDCYFRDGTSLEVNTPGGISCFGHLLGSTIRTLRRAAENLPKGYDLNAVSAYDIKTDLSAAPPDVFESGCGPVRNAYEGWEEKAAYSDPDSKLRFAGGHIHMSGWEMDTLRDEKQRADYCSFVTKQLDLYLAVPIIYLGIEGENGKLRRKVYGKAGEYRYQEYTAPKEDPVSARGLEYRVLGPEWARDIGLAQLTLRMARAIGVRAVDLWRKAEEPTTLLNEARAAINEGDTTAIFESPAYQERFHLLLAAGYNISGGRVTVKHFKFMRENQEKLFKQMTLHKWAQDAHVNWPECLPRWGYKEETPK